MTKISLLGAVFCAFVLTDCASGLNLAKFSIATTQNMPLPSNIKKGEYVEGSVCAKYLFGFQLGGELNDRVSSAVAEALIIAHKRGEPADALTNVQIRTETTSYLGIYATDCVYAKGQAVGVK